MPSEDMHGDPLIILLVEDNLPHAELVKRSLGEHEIANKIYHVSDEEAALAYLFRQGVYADPATSPRPHIMLLDLRLPKVSGLDSRFTNSRSLSSPQALALETLWIFSIVSRCNAFEGK